MSDISDSARLQFILELITDIEKIQHRHGGIDESISDFEGKHAILMCLQQIGETLGNLKDTDLKEKLEARAAYGMRNIIAHAYLGVNMKIIKSIIEEKFPQMKQIIGEKLKERL